MIKNKYAAFGLFMILVIVFWNLLDLLYSMFISRNGYQFAAGNDLGLPVVTAAGAGYFLFLRDRGE